MSETGHDGPRPQDLPTDRQILGFRRLALAAQVLIGAQTAWNLVIAATGGTRSSFFPVTAPLSIALLFAPAALFLLWFNRCRLNAELFAPDGLRYSPGWAMGAWFIPLASWWIPRRVALDIWRATAPGGRSLLINIWWAAWLLRTVGAVFVDNINHQSFGYSPYDVTVGLLAGALAILMIQQLTSRQTSRLHALAQPA